jgi:hypothetical protein
MSLGSFSSSSRSAVASFPLSFWITFWDLQFGSHALGGVRSQRFHHGPDVLGTVSTTPTNDRGPQIPHPDGVFGHLNGGGAVDSLAIDEDRHPSI